MSAGLERGTIDTEASRLSRSGSASEVVRSTVSVPTTRIAETPARYGATPSPVRSRARAKLAATSSAVNSAPLWKRIPGLRWKRQVVSSGFSQRSASAGRRRRLPSRLTSPS